MTVDIDKLKQELVKAEKEKKDQQTIVEFQQIKNKYEGKVYATRTFERRSKTASDGAYWVESVYMEEGKIYAKIWSVSRNKYDTNYKFSPHHYGYNRHISNDCLTSDNYNAHYVMSTKIPFYYKFNISVEKFKQLWNSATEFEFLLSEAFEKNVKDYTDDFIRHGDSNDEDRLIEAYSNIGLDYFDMLKYPVVFRAIEYATLPGFERNRFLLKYTAKRTLEYQIKLWEKEKADPWCSPRAYSWLTDRINTVQTFIKDQQL